MKKLEKKLRKLGFEGTDTELRNFLDFKINGEVRVRVILSEQTFNYFKEGSYEAFLSTWLPFSSIKDLKKQVKEHTGVELKKIDTPVTKEKLRKYGWVECKHLSSFMDHPKMFLNGISYNCTTKEVTIDNKPFTPCPTMSQLKSYVLGHTGEKMQKVKKDKEVTNVASDITSVSVESLKPIELPKRWEDIKLGDGMQVDWVNNNSRIITEPFYFLKIDRDEHALPQGLGSPMLATCQLLLLRDVYRQGWKPDWRSNNGITEKFAIAFSDNKVHFRKYFGDYASQWAFQSEEITKLFLKNFEPLLQEHYKLYN